MFSSICYGIKHSTNSQILEQVFFPHAKDSNGGANNRNNDNFHKAVWIILERQVYVCPPQAKYDGWHGHGNR